MKLSEVKSERKKVVMDFDDLGSLNVTYIPGALTPETEDELVAVMNEPGQSKFICDLLCKLIEDWDLEGDDGAPIPLTLEGLKPVPINFLGGVLEKIQQDMNPGEAQGD